MEIFGETQIFHTNLKSLLIFFLGNLNKGTPFQIVWDPSKTLFRGFVINYMARKNMTMKQNYVKIFADLKVLEFNKQKDP